jgi:hypothetical protein
MNERLVGGCACGAVRYELRSEPFEAGWCHCTTCQRLSGAPGMVYASVGRGDFVYVKGAGVVRGVALSRFARRAFCGDCGSPLTITYDFQPETIDFTIATLDEPGRVSPAAHIFWASRPAWFEIEDGLPRHAQFRPGTRGLKGTAPPE